ncbi:MAG: murein biosynthesis integral membrane protein MurJ [Candidatus Synoicihabitans palmerolidicus]|nr:murein biosynthesis integral membrane protein MurJ [Candidatus Synoicihabitans palmerolidicus]
MSRSLKNIGIVSVATMGSRVLGLGRDVLITAVFGISPLASAFVTAFTLPNLFRRLLGEGALTAALVPTLNDELVRRERSGAFGLVNQVASWLGLVTLGIVLVSMGSLAWLADGELLTRLSDDPDQVARWRLAAELAVLLFPYLIFVCLSAAFSAALQTLGRFVAPALSPIWLNLAMIGLLAGAVWVGDVRLGDARMRWLCAGVLLGGLGQMLVPGLALMREGWRPRVAFQLSPAMKSILWLMGSTVSGSAVYLINLAVSRTIGLSLNGSAAAILNLATRLMELPIGVFGIAVTTVVFPLIANYAAKEDWTNLARAYHKGMRLVLAINVPAAVGMVVLGTPLIRLLFQRGAFTEEATALMAPVLVVFAIGLPVFAYVNLMLRAFYAEKDTKTPVRAAVLSFGVNVGLSLGLMGPLSTVGLAVASTVAVVAQAVYLHRALTAKRSTLGMGPMGRSVVKIVVASGLMGAVVWGGRRLVGLWVGATPIGDLLLIGTLVPVGVLVYGGLVWILRLEGRDELLGMLRGRKPAAGDRQKS